jgi:hypothetical protein
MHRTASIECAFTQHIQVNQIVVLQLEAGCSVITSLDDM